MNFLLIDAFADQPFAGNPAAVVLLPQPALMIGCSVSPWNSIRLRRHISWRVAVVLTISRWFTPQREVPLCGHATLAAAGAGGMESGKRRRVDPFHHPLQWRTAVRLDGKLIAMDFPATPPTPAPLPPSAPKCWASQAPWNASVPQP